MPVPMPLPALAPESQDNKVRAADAAGAAGRLAPAPESAGPSLAPAPAATSSRKPARILVADDERRIRLAIRSCLEAEGYTVY